MHLFITRCPSCQQAFKITEAQLKAKDGTVRCGFCQNVFNAKDSLYRSADAESDSLQRAEREEEMERQAKASMAALASQLQGFDAVDDEGTQVASAGLVGVRADNQSGPVRQDVINAAAGSTIEVITHNAPKAPEETYEEEPEAFEPQEEPARRARRWPWVLVALAALILIGVQGTVSYRAEILAKLPQSAVYFDRVCQYVVCAPIEEPAPQTAQAPQAEIPQASTAPAANAVSIVEHRLQKVGEGQEWAIGVTLRNETSSEQPYPILTVVLKGEKEDILTRRMVKPEEYLIDKNARLAAGATTEVAIAFTLTEGDPATLAVEIEPVL